jgi:hypothetical protein
VADKPSEQCVNFSLFFIIAWISLVRLKMHREEH